MTIKTMPIRWHEDGYSVVKERMFHATGEKEFYQYEKAEYGEALDSYRDTCIESASTATMSNVSTKVSLVDNGTREIEFQVEFKTHHKSSKDGTRKRRKTQSATL